MKTLQCRGCGREFLWARKRKYCSTECRKEHYNLERRATNRGPSIGSQMLSENRELVDRGKKRCSKCRRILSLSEFRKERRGLGGATAQCATCLASKDKQAKRYARRRAGRKTRAEIQAGVRARRIERMFVAHHKARIKEMLRAEAPSNTERYRSRYRGNPEFQAKERLRRQINKAAKRDGVGELIRAAIRRDGDSLTVERLLGYSIFEFMAHMEKQFTKGMTWAHWRKGEIHIDHIIPQKEFDLSDPAEYRSCWSLSNLQPLWAKSNLKKSFHRVKLL